MNAELTLDTQNGETARHSGTDTIAEPPLEPGKTKIESEVKESHGLMLAFCIVSGLGSLFSLSFQTYISSQITVMERAFGLSSYKSGILLSANDIGFVVTVLFASHFLSRYVNFINSKHPQNVEPYLIIALTALVGGLSLSVGSETGPEEKPSLFSLRKRAFSNILKILLPKNEKFQIKNSDILHISAQNIDCGYSLESPCQGGSNEYPQSMFLSRNKKNNVYPCKLQFYYIKMGFKGVKII